MKRIHLLGIQGAAHSFEPLARELASRGERLGWLDWRPEEPAPGVSGGLEEASKLPVLRAVAVGAGGSVAIKPVAGPPVVHDVLREHFRGCLAVLVRGATGAEVATVQATDDGFVMTAGAEQWTLDAAGLADRLRKPRPFGDA